MNVIFQDLAPEPGGYGEKSKTSAIVTVMEEYVRRQKMRALLVLRGKVQIEYDWKQEEALELKAAEEQRP